MAYTRTSTASQMKEPIPIAPKVLGVFLFGRGVLFACFWILAAGFAFALPGGSHAASLLDRIRSVLLISTFLGIVTLSCVGGILCFRIRKNGWYLSVWAIILSLGWSFWGLISAYHISQEIVEARKSDVNHWVPFLCFYLPMFLFMAAPPVLGLVYLLRPAGRKTFGIGAL